MNNKWVGPVPEIKFGRENSLQSQISYIFKSWQNQCSLFLIGAQKCLKNGGVEVTGQSLDVDQS